MLVKTKPGIIMTLAGIGEPGYAGDGGPASFASLNEPKNIALDATGWLYIADSENHVIRRVDLATGMIVTVAGRANDQTPVPSPADHAVSSDGPGEADPLAGSFEEPPQKFVQLSDVSGTVRFVAGTVSGSERFQGDGGEATRALLNFPTAVAVDRQGILYIADTMNHRVRRVDAAGIITTIAGTGQHRFSGDGGPAESASFNEPSALACDPKGYLYVADQSNNRVRKIDLTSGLITTAAGNGVGTYDGDGMPAPQASLSGPSGLALGLDGALYIADTFNGRIRRVDPDTGILSTVVGDGGDYRYQGLANEFSTSLSRPYGIALEADGHLLVTDSDSHLIRRWHRQKKIIMRVAGSGTAGYGGDGGVPADSSLSFPFGIAVDAHGNVYIADTFNHRIRVIAV